MAQVLVTPAAVPPGYVFDYLEKASNSAVSATTEAAASTIHTSNAVTYDGSTTIWIEFWAPYVDVAANAGSNNIQFCLYDGASSIGLFSLNGGGSTAAVDQGGVTLKRRLTPSAGAHTYSIRAFRSNANCTVVGGAGGVGVSMPMYIQQTKAG